MTHIDVSYDGHFESRSDSVVKAGALACALFLALTVIAGFFLKIEGAVIASAEIVSTGQNRVIQHREGGIIGKLLVSDGDFVEEGMPVIVLDGRQIESEFNVLRFRQIELRARIARFEALLNNNDTYGFTWLRSNQNTQSEIRQSIETQKRLFQADLDSYRSSVKRLTQTIGNLVSELDAVSEQIQTTRKQSGILEQQLLEVSPLVEDQLVAKSREWQLKREQIGAQSELDSLIVSKTRLLTQISQAKNDYQQFLSDHNQKVLTKLEEAETELQSTDQSYDQANDQLTRRVIKSPVTGYVHKLQFRNAQGVVAPGEMIMEIVPTLTGHQLMARVRISDIDDVHEGQDVKVRFDALDMLTTPELNGTVSSISADSIIEQETPYPFYKVFIAVDAEELEKLGGTEIISGMPATAMLRTSDRSMLSYLFRPVEQQMSRAFR